jgi:hypothetical protein
MGQWDIPIIAGVGIIGGYFIWTNWDYIQSIFTLPPPENGNGKTPFDEEEGQDTKPVPNGKESGNGEETEKTSSGDYDCKKACRNCWCKSYSENCSGSCSKCCGSSRIASKCGGQGVKSCKGGGTTSGGDGGGDGGDGEGPGAGAFYASAAEQRITIA